MIESKKILDTDSPITIVRVANGFKLGPAKEPWAYSCKDDYSIPNEEYVFATIKDVFEFLSDHFTDEQ